VKLTVIQALLALFGAWLVFRGLRRFAGVALMAALLVGAVAIAAGELWSAASSSSSSTAARPLDAVRAIGRCDLQPAPQTPRRSSR
jgi:hypothetical protein